MKNAIIISGAKFNSFKFPGVYLWKRGRKYLYIGQAESVWRRLIDHGVIGKVSPVLPDDKIIIVACPMEELNKKETELIMRHAPLYNGPVPGQNMVRRLSFKKMVVAQKLAQSGVGETIKLKSAFVLALKRAVKAMERWE